MKLHFVESMDEVLRIALEREVVALPVTAAAGVEALPRGSASPLGAALLMRILGRGRRARTGADRVRH